MMLRKRKEVKISNKCIRRFSKKTGILHVHKYNLPQVSHKLDQAFKKLKWQRGTPWRGEMISLNCLPFASARLEQNGTSTELELRKLKQVLYKKRTARNIKQMRRQLGQNATSELYVTAEKNHVRSFITNQLGMETAEDMPHCYNKCDLMERIGITLHCM
jgi:hypothetical protein